jgi:glycosyltransferase involved in cell wall biosynthesis
MVIVIHDFSKVVNILHNNVSVATQKETIAECLIRVSSLFSNEIIVWTHVSIKDSIDLNYIRKKHENEVLTFNPEGFEYMLEEIGYIDIRSVFINIKKDVKFATWQLSSCVGAIDAGMLGSLRLNYKLNDFDYFLVSLGKEALKNGFFPFSDPRMLIKDPKSYFVRKCTLNQLLVFVRAHYSIKQYCMLFLSLIIFDRKFPISSFLISLFRRKKYVTIENYIPTFKKQEAYNKHENSIDIIIPSVGREKYLRDVLNDLNNQSHLPNNVILVEQNNGDSLEIPYYNIDQKKWRFNLIHIIENKYGAVNARNVAIKHVQSNWTFFADDDIRLEKDLISNVLQYLISNSLNAVSLASYKKGEIIDKNIPPVFWSEFSSGCSIVKSNWVINTYFDKAFEFGFGEDTDYGFQLRNKGCEIIYLNKFPIYHLKAPVGGFRKKILKEWENDIIHPYPEPTITKCAQKNYNSHQLKGFRLYYLFKNNPFFLWTILRYYQFKASLKYAKK